MAKADNRKLYTLDDIITENNALLQLKEEIVLLSNSDSNALIYGETGTGKQLFAEAMHTAGKRKDRPFIAMNCAAIPENLTESILFGSEKGAFTGAETKPGLFEQANGGTLFLDELNSMKPDLQSKLLKVIEEGYCRRLGGTRDYYFDVRLIVAMNESPEQLVLKGRLRKDLYYRINIARVSIPPLRERPEDVSLLIPYFIAQFNRRTGREILGISHDATMFLSHYDWPGNVRELENMIESAFNLERSKYIQRNVIENIIQRNGLAISSESEADFNSSEKLQSVPESSSTDADSGSAENASGSIDSKARRSGSETHSYGSSDFISYILSMETIDMDRLLKEYESAIITAVLDSEDSMAKAARRLGMSPQKFSYRVKVLGIDALKK